MGKEKEGLIDGQYIDGLRASGTVGDVGIGYGIIIKIPLSDIDSAEALLKEMWK